MQPFDNVTLPLSVAEADPTVLRKPNSTRQAPTGGPSQALVPDSWEVHMLEALSARSAEVETAEWALDQNMSVRNEQIKAALTAGIPVHEVSAATGLSIVELEQIADARTPKRSSPIAS
ncbi:hypothetical protein [Arthrobacter mangrovi]|uniref:Uncharacterized protein n=1 Tax=Arthrobacter mangrovi TaxID=2966350 RepID=A0ABQ5MZ36_9MICC|nr:hypothetical protein [Arthrobacter mangrovi]GLB68957.1 hypothetical protein AHIS1636_34000 [Arthrobacter mangrovi]